jgi:hypothetical protein
VNGSSRVALLDRLAEATREVRRAAEAGALERVAAALALRQRIIDEALSLDTASAPLTPQARRVLEHSLAEQERITALLAAQRQNLLASFQRVARGRRAATGYRPGPAQPTRLMDRKV